MVCLGMVRLLKAGVLNTVEVVDDTRPFSSFSSKGTLHRMNQSIAINTASSCITVPEHPELGVP